MTRASLPKSEPMPVPTEPPVASPEAMAGAVLEEVAARAVSATKRRTHRRVLAVLGVILIAVAFLIYKGIGSAISYYEPVNVALAQRGELGTSPFRLEGVVVAGTVKKVPSGVAFQVEWKHESVAVVATSTPPSMFQPGMPVVLDGHFLPGSEAIFDCDQIMVKHSNVYTPAGSKAPAQQGGASA